MLTPVERVLVLKGADLLKDVGPRHLLGLANVAREIEIFEGDGIYDEADPADALYIVVEGKVELWSGERKISEVGPGEAFGTWSLVDDSARGHRAQCVQDGLTLALHRDEFYDIAAGDLALLQELVRVLAKRLRALAETPEEARVEGEGVERPEAVVEAESAATATASVAASAASSFTPATAAAQAPATTPGDSLKAAALGKPAPEGETAPVESDEDEHDGVMTPEVERAGGLDESPETGATAIPKPDTKES